MTTQEFETALTGKMHLIVLRHQNYMTLLEQYGNEQCMCDEDYGCNRCANIARVKMRLKKLEDFVNDNT